jgi:choline kinase
MSATSQTAEQTVPDAVILGAGPPHQGELPSALRETQQGVPVLHWLLDALGAASDSVTFVGGYQADAIRKRYPGLRLVDNREWSNTGSGASLLAAPLRRGRPLLAAYSDILFRHEVVVRMLDGITADITVAWDSAWRHRYNGRQETDLERCEKVAVGDAALVRLGADLPVDWADGEFIGLVRFSPAAVDRLIALGADRPDSLRKVHLSGLIEYLRADGCKVAGIDVAGDWAEVNEPRDIAHFVLGTKAETLKRLRAVVREAVIQDQVAFTVARWRREPEAVAAEIRAQLGARLLVVRSSARSEDSFYSANAGAYDSVLNVDAGHGLESAVGTVIASYDDARDDDQVLVQPMVLEVVLSGVAFTRTLEYGAPWYVINYEVGEDTKSITSGASQHHRTLLLRRGTEPRELPEARLAGVIRALKEIERLLGFDALDIEFALDRAGVVHVLQVRPIAVKREQYEVPDERCFAMIEQARETWRLIAQPPPHLPGHPEPVYGIMPDWNPAEIIGTAPGALAESLYRSLIMDEVWARQRAEYGYRDVRPAPLLVNFAGRPYVDVRLSLASFIPATLSDELAGRLLDFYLKWLRAHPELHDKVEFEVVPTCMSPGFENWEKRLREQGGFSAAEIAELRRGLVGVAQEGFRRTAGDLRSLDLLVRRYDAIQVAGLPPLERARLLLADCRSLGTLPFAHLARSGFVAVTLLKGAEAAGAISRAASESFFSTVHTVSSELSQDARAVRSGSLPWDKFVAKYGHLRPGTYDITSPRYDADEEYFLRPLVQGGEGAVATADATVWQAERERFHAAVVGTGLVVNTAELDTFLRQAIEGRELAKFLFSRNLSAAIEAIAQAGEAVGLSRTELAELRLEEIMALRDPRHAGAEEVARLRELARMGRGGRRIAAALELPALITGEQDFDVFVTGADVPNFVGSRAITAPCHLLETASSAMGAKLEGRIVLIPQADPGYDWIFGQSIAGLVTLYGGANSHMAIRAAEFGLPAAIGIGERRYKEVAAASLLELDPSNRVLRVVR